MIYLINQTIFQQYEDINVNIKPERLKVFIKKAQELDLKPLLGYALYYQLIAYCNDDGTIKEDAPRAYKDLLNGCEYLDEYGRIVLYEGLAPALVYFTFARFIENDAIHYTASGPVIKQHDNGNALSSPEITKLVQQQRSIANAYANDIERFLRDNQENFPLWHYNEKNKSSRQSGPRIRGIDKTDFNYPGTINNYNLPIIDFLN
ncbi:hypothetical protein [Mucilaginibacter endophyticus]|uniref:DUF6712 family protein n=1 Tax=Mucilaginibacter endophyticus TaxID=2675003 RepID=UPI000E0D7387|nr:hypothetical protein [Mucilaginibacter endophyticus]